MWGTDVERSRRRLVVAGLATTAVVATGCSAGAEPVRVGGPGVEATVGDMQLRNIRLDNPPGGVYEVGSAALLGVAMVNSGGAAERLVGVSGPDFTGVVVDEEAPTSTPSVVIPAGETVYSDGPDGPVVVLVDIDDTLTTAQYLEVTLEFEEAGEVTVQAPVSAPLRLSLDRYLREQRGD